MSNRAVVVCAALWAAGVATGFTVLWRYKATPGIDQVRSPALWPADSRIEKSPDRPTLVMFAHPRCPCTHASISELARLLAHLSDKVSTHVLVVEPSGAPATWTDTELWRRATAIHGVRVVRDEGGREAARFRALVSGLTVLYAADGKRLFSGGITSSRGHEGDSFGQHRILAVLNGGWPDRDDSPVFGCSLGVENRAPTQPETQEVTQ